MPQIDFNPNVNANQAIQQANLANVLENLEGKTPLSSILSGSSLTISDGSADLEALAAKLGLETSSVKEGSLKNALNSMSEALGKAKESNSEAWQIISGYTDELNTLIDKTVVNEDGAPVLDENGNPKIHKGAITIAQEEIAALDAEITGLNGEISTLNNTIAEQQTELADLKEQLKNATDDAAKAELATQINSLEGTIASNQATLGEKTAALSTKETARTEKQATLDNLNARKTELDTAIANEVKKLVDAQKLANTTKTQRDEIVNSAHVNDDKEAERSQEEEKYLDTHSTVRIIQDAIARHDTDMLDTIDGKRETKV